MKRSSALSDPSGRAPHPPLTDYYGAGDERVGWIRALFDKTAEDYDRMERLIGFGRGRRYRRQALRRAGLAAGMSALDVGAGTGLVTKEALAITGPEGQVTAIDPSAGMLEAARFPAPVNVLQGTAEQLPVPADCYDFLSMGFALRHVSDLDLAFAEFHRALRVGGRLCILEITRPRRRLSTAFVRFYIRLVVPALAALIARRRETATLMRYYWDTIEACVPPAEVLVALRRAGFSDARHAVALGISSEYTATKRG